MTKHVAIGSCTVGALIALHALGAAVDLGAFTWQAVIGPSREALDKFGWIMTYLTLWGQLTQGLYFAFAFIVSLKIRSDMAEGWGWLARSHSQSAAFVDRNLSDNTKALIRHRDRFFTLAFVTGNMVGLGFWCLLFPHASARKAFLSSTDNTVLCLLQHGFTFIIINVETLVTRHKYGRWFTELPIVVVYGLCYLGWNILVHVETGAWAYPSIQSGHSLGVDIGLYTGLELFFFGMYFVGRIITAGFWGWRDRVEARKDRQNRGDSRDALLFSGGAEVEAQNF